ncbi:acyl-CoA dehydrogenase [Streptomyces sp. NPDC046900]|uniref:acyl-CoA dehydrogenase n=1 Tax=Streptomyces sp. NPDC046900 TaxID=3155473 RepID=UPI00340FC2FB
MVSAHARLKAAEAFSAAADSTVDPMTRRLLHSLCRLFLLRTLRDHTGDLLAEGHLTPDQVRALPQTLDTVVADLAPHMTTLVDAFDFPTERLSAIPIASGGSIGGRRARGRGAPRGCSWEGARPCGRAQRSRPVTKSADPPFRPSPDRGGDRWACPVRTTHTRGGACAGGPGAGLCPLSPGCPVTVGGAAAVQVVGPDGLPGRRQTRPGRNKGDHRGDDPLGCHRSAAAGVTPTGSRSNGPVDHWVKAPPS